MSGRISEYFSIRKQEKEEFARFLEETSGKISIAAREYRDIFRNGSEYIDIHTVNSWKQRFSSVHDSASSYLKDGMIEKKKLPRKYAETFSSITAMYAHIDEMRAEHNRKITTGAKSAVTEAYAAFSKVLAGKTPSDEQTDAILARDSRVLISGAPSTGKSTALKAKMEYLKAKQEKYGASDGGKMIFIDASDIKNVSDLAYEILSDAGCAPERLPDRSDTSDISEILLSEAEKYIAEAIAPAAASAQIDNAYRSRLIDYYLRFHIAGHTAFDFKSREEYDNYLRIFPPVSLKGEHMRSYEELDIANFLYALGVKYEYRAPFGKAADLRGARTRYSPDFTLTDNGVCINVYEFDESGSVAYSGESTLTDAETVSKKYAERIDEIRAIHEEAEVPLIECYSHEKMSGSMLSKLQAGLTAAGVSFNILKDSELLEAITERDGDFTHILAEGLRDGAEIMLASEMSENILLDLSRTKSKTASALYKRHERMMSLIMPFYEHYIKSVPCDDYRLISRATDVLEGRRLPCPYSHIFIDNAENMCACTMRLVSAVTDVSGCGVTAAGCQWTSYTGHRGADSVYLTEFGRFMPGFIEAECAHVFDMPGNIFGKMKDFAENGGGYMGYKPCADDSDGHIEVLDVDYGMNVREKLTELTESIAREGGTSSILVVCRYEKELEMYRDMLSGCKNVTCASVFDARGKYDAVIWVNMKYSDFGFPDERMCLNNISALALRRPLSAVFDAERGMLCKAMSLTKGRFMILRDENDLSPYARELIPAE